MKKNKSRKLFSILILSATFLITPFFVKADSPSVNIKIGVYAGDQILYKGNLQVTPCDESTKNPTKTLNAMCAIDQLATIQNWTVKKTEYDFGTTVDDINTYKSAYPKFWLYFINKEPGADALNKHILSQGENLEFVYDTNLIKVTTPTSITAGETSTLEATYFDMINWARNPLENVTYVINGIESQSADGKFQITWQPNTTYSISVKKSGFVNSDGVTVTSGSLPVTQPDNFNLQSAVNFVKNALNEGILTDMVSDWSLISAGAYKDDVDFLNKAKEIASKDFGTFNSVTDVERKAMALMSLGIKPWEGKNDLIKTLLTYFDGTQFGSKDIVNDDIFALIVLNKSGFLTNDDEIKNSIKEILSFQKPNGSWDSIDMTSASIQTLSPFINQTEVATALLKAKQNLKDSQKPNGSFGNPFATTWAIQAIRALSENPKDWIKEGKNPIDYLASIQNVDGGIDYNGSKEDRVWLTSYVIPAYMNKTWPEIITINASWPDLSKRTRKEEASQPIKPATNSSGVFMSSFPIDPQIFLRIEAPQNTSAGVETELKVSLTGIDKKPIENGRIVWSFGDGTYKEGYYISHAWQIPGEYMLVAEASSNVFNTSIRQKISVTKADVQITNFKKGDTGFIELKNNSKNDINLSHWILNQNQKQFTLPKNTFIPPNATTSIPNTVTKISESGEISLKYPNGINHFDFKIPETKNLALNKNRKDENQIALKNKNLTASIGNLNTKSSEKINFGDKTFDFISNFLKKIWPL
jgi:hypothetical protein